MEHNNPIPPRIPGTRKIIGAHEKPGAGKIPVAMTAFQTSDSPIPENEKVRKQKKLDDIFESRIEIQRNANRAVTESDYNKFAIFMSKLSTLIAEVEALRDLPGSDVVYKSLTEERNLLIKESDKVFNTQPSSNLTQTARPEENEGQPASLSTMGNGIGLQNIPHKPEGIHVDESLDELNKFPSEAEEKPAVLKDNIQDDLKNLQRVGKVVFEPGVGKGSIQGIIELKQQLREKYNGDFPQEIQDFINRDETDEAIRFGFYAPNSLNESALIPEGSTLSLDSKGNLIFFNAKTGKEVRKYDGEMFHFEQAKS